MEQEKKNELFALIDEYRLIREDELMFHIRKSMEKVRTTCEKLELGGKINMLVRDLPLTHKERNRLLDYTNSFLPLWVRVIQLGIDASIVVGGFLLVTYLMKRK